MPPPRVLLLIDLFPPIVGGAETHARDVVQALRALDVPVTVLTRRALPDLPEDERLPNGARVLRVRARSRSPRFAKYAVIPSFLRTLREIADEYDLIYLCGFRVLGWPVLGLARRLGKPVVLRAEVCGEFSGGFIWDRPGRGCNHLLRLAAAPLVALRNRRLRRAGACLAISSVIEDEYLAAGVPPDRIHRIPNGIDLKRFRPEPRADRRALGLPAEGPLFVYSGKLNRGKGLELLLDAWRVWVGERRPGHLLLVGAGGGQFLSCETALRRYVETHQLDARVTFAGYQTNVEHWLRASDVFLFPSEAESFGLAPLEANACGLPAISTPAGALAETVPDQEAGLSFPVGDHEALLHAMRRLADDPALRLALGQRALTRVRALYAFPVIAQQHLALFQSLTPSRSAP